MTAPKKASSDPKGGIAVQLAHEIEQAVLRFPDDADIALSALAMVAADILQASGCSPAVFTEQVEICTRLMAGHRAARSS